MKELVIISGKGGTGKTSITAALAGLAGGAVLADCDVDAADLHLLLHPVINIRHTFVCGHEAVIDIDRCRGCGACRKVCRFRAVTMTGKNAAIDPYACEGCGVCVEFCPAGAVAFPERLCGEWYESETAYGPMVHAKLAPAAENSGKLVTQVRKAARELAGRQGRGLILTDGPPGVGCPVIASIGGASAALIVVEPTVSGAHDLKRVLELTEHFQVPALVCVNKFDLNRDASAGIVETARRAGAGTVGMIPYDKAFTEAMVAGKILPDHTRSQTTENIADLWENIRRLI